jgi:hypothetical protein
MRACLPNAEQWFLEGGRKGHLQKVVLVILALIYEVYMRLIISFISLFFFTVAYVYATDSINPTINVDENSISNQQLQEIDSILKENSRWDKRGYDCKNFTQVAYLVLTNQKKNHVFNWLAWSLQYDGSDKIMRRQPEICPKTNELTFLPACTKYITYKDWRLATEAFWNKGLYVLEVGQDRYLAHDPLRGTTILSKDEWAQRLIDGLCVEYNIHNKTATEKKLFVDKQYIRNIIGSVGRWLNEGELTNVDDWVVFDEF